MNGLLQQVMKERVSPSQCVAERGVPRPFLNAWRLLLKMNGAQLERLASEMNMPVDSARSLLFAMEMTGWVQRVPGAWFVPASMCPLAAKLHINVFSSQRIGFNKLTSGLYLVAHQGREQFISNHCIFNGDF